MSHLQYTAFMAARTKVRAGVRSKRPALPFIAPEEHYATKEDTAKIETKIANLRTELKGDIANLRTELKGDIANLRTELKGDIANSKAQIIMWVAGLQLASIGIIIAVLK